MSEEPEIIRPMDGYEYGESFIWLKFSDELPVYVDLSSFKKSFIKICSKYPAFNIGAIPQKWIKLPINTEKSIKETEYIEKKEIEDMSSIDKHDNHLWYINISHKNKNHTQIKFCVSHALCDGRTLGSMFSIILHVVLDSLSENEKNILLQKTNLKNLENLPEPSNLCEFGQKNNYYIEKIPENLLKNLPESWQQYKSLNLPKITLPTHYIGKYFEYSIIDWNNYYNKFLQKNIKLSLQAAMMASQSRALREYCKLNYDFPIITNLMYDTRMSPLAKNEMKNRKFFCNAGSGFPSVIGQNDWEKDIIYCTEVLKKNVKLNDAVAMIIQIANAMNEKTLKFNPPKLPVYCKSNIVVTTFIDKFNGFIEPRFGVCLDCGSDYFVCQYAWVCNDKIYFMLLYPENLVPEYPESFKKKFDELFEFLKEASK